MVHYVCSQNIFSLYLLILYFLLNIAILLRKYILIFTMFIIIIIIIYFKVKVISRKVNI